PLTRIPRSEYARECKVPWRTTDVGRGGGASMGIGSHTRRTARAIRRTGRVIGIAALAAGLVGIAATAARAQDGRITVTDPKQDGKVTITIKCKRANKTV